MSGVTIADWLFETMDRLGKAGVDSPRRDALVLLEDSLGKDRAWVLAHPEFELNVKGSAFLTLEKKIERRVKREPLAYIRGKAWFYGRFFEVNSDVMIPRPESEAFIQLLKEIVEGSSFHIIDVGTGSGCLAITAELELLNATVSALDISPRALEIAKRNAQTLEAKVECIKSDLLSTVIDIIDSDIIILANLPYVPDGLITSPEIEQEPALALFSGNDGLDHYRRLWQQIASIKNKPQFVLTESLEKQHSSVEKLAISSGYTMKKAEQLTQLFVRT